MRFTDGFLNTYSFLYNKFPFCFMLLWILFFKIRHKCSNLSLSFCTNWDVCVTLPPLLIWCITLLSWTCVWLALFLNYLVKFILFHEPDSICQKVFNNKFILVDTELLKFSFLFLNFSNLVFFLAICSFYIISKFISLRLSIFFIFIMSIAFSVISWCFILTSYMQT